MPKEMIRFEARSFMLKLDAAMGECGFSMETQQKINVSLGDILDKECPGWDYDG